MGEQREPREHVSHVVRHYHRGIICPSEMWRQIADALTPATATAVLDSLLPSVQEQLQAVWLDLPPGAYIARSPPATPADEDFQAVCVQIVRWCEARCPPPVLPAEPDGLIRVRVEGGTVQEWRPWVEKSPHREH